MSKTLLEFDFLPNSKIDRQGPNRAGKKDSCYQGQQQGKMVDPALVVFAAFCLPLFPGRQDLKTPYKGRQTDQEGHVGDIVDQAVFKNQRSAPAGAGQYPGKYQV